MHRRAPASLICAALAAAALLSTACAEVTDLPTLKKRDLEFKPPQSSKLFDSNGRLITTFHGVQNRTVIPLRRVPRHVRRAIIAIEDERFFQHDGVDVRAIARAVVANVKSGGIKEGGSTITQQYVKNVIIAPGEVAAKTLQRKIDEAALARQLETKLSKKQILFRYLNTVYFGGGAYGIQAAAKTYFNRPARRLTLSQAAMLAGVIRSPSLYDPFRHPRRSKARRNLVLDKMEELGWARPRHVAKAKKANLTLYKTEDTGRYAAPYFVDYVTRLIKFDPRLDALGKTWRQREKRLFTGGLRIYTTVDLGMQRAAEEAVRQVLPYPDDPHAALVALEPDTGYVRAMVGGRDYFAKRKKDRFAKLNLAILAEPDLGQKAIDPVTGKKVHKAPGTGRQAGSAFKPFALAEALRQGIPLSKTYKASGSMVFPGEDNGEPWTVQNYEGSEFGTVTLLEATISSINVVYAQVILEVGPENVVELAHAMGIRTPLLPVPSAVLGANPVNALDMASAYSTLANNGEHHPPVAITRIVDSTTGKTVYEDETRERKVLEPGTAYLEISALQKVITGGTGTAALAYLGGRPAAGKTGTAQEYRDAWFAGFTPDLAAAVWVGYPEGSIEMKTACYTPGCRVTRIQVSGGTWPTQIWGGFMARALAGAPPTPFTVPEDAGLISVTIDSRTGCVATESTPDQYKVTQYFDADNPPSNSCETPTNSVPSVIGYSVSSAQSLLSGEGFTARVVTKAQPVAAKARNNSELVWKQEPAAGTELAEGSSVTIYANP
ncbi:MAG: transglycosylase domain-containing protein [Chloroflexota bacterium]|nr:transglycosylase domain-containing protein [Chloroflexota bacterium]